jgi:mannitol/fructose-specific phosphotransferase system IIA component (Ntr-type)
MSIQEREREEQSTMLENGVAIPHGILPDPAPLVCAMGVSPEGLSYGLEGERANIVFTILGSLCVRKDYLGILARIARHFRGPDLKDKILSAPSAEEILNLIRSAERY